MYEGSLYPRNFEQEKDLDTKVTKEPEGDLERERHEISRNPRKIADVFRMTRTENYGIDTKEIPV